MLPLTKMLLCTQPTGSSLKFKFWNLILVVKSQILAFYTKFEDLTGVFLNFSNKCICSTVLEKKIVYKTFSEKFFCVKEI